MKSMDPYATLQVGREASAVEIKKAYRKLALKFHPDTSDGEDKAGEKIKEINDAYSILKDPEKKKEFDLGGSGWGNGGSGRRSYGGPGAYEDISKGCGNFECKRRHGVGRCFGSGRSSVRMAFKHPFSKYHYDRGYVFDIQLTKEEAAAGAEKTVNITNGSRTGSICFRTQSGLHDGDTLIMKSGNPWQRGGDLYLKVTVVD